jgi:hypothetical protein
LSTLFGLLTLLAYTRFVQKPEAGSQKSETEGKQLPTSVLGLPASGFYWLALIFFALGLMAKPMLVTLPFVMLLLDYWPLGRFQNLQSNQPSTFNLFASGLRKMAVLSAYNGFVHRYFSGSTRRRDGHAA